MSTVTIEAMIDGQVWSAAQLDRVRYGRDLHVLHQMKRLGAAVEHEGRPLTDDEIDYLTASQAHEVNVATRLAQGPDGVRRLYAEQLRTSDRWWKDVTAASDGRPVQIARAELAVTGVTWERLRAHITDFDQVQRGVVETNPEHFSFRSTGIGDASAMETFGMYGVPTDLVVTADPDIAPPFPPDEGYQLLLAGRVRLAGDGTPIDAVAYHQFRPTSDGMLVKLATAFPAAAPREFVDGHQIHLAVEFTASLRRIAAHQPVA